MNDRRWNRALRATMPLVVAGAMTVSMNLTGQIDAASAAPKKPAKAKGTLTKAAPTAAAVTVAPTVVRAAVVPSGHTVVSGDTVSTIAQHYGLSTASLLAINGLGWKSLIFPGQVLKLSTSAGVSTPSPSAQATSAVGGRYAIQKGDTISGIAVRFGVTTQAILTANGLGWSSIIYPGQTIAIPGATMTTVAAVTPIATADPPSTPPVAAPGSVYVVVSGDTVSAIAGRHGVAVGDVLAANGLNTASVIHPGQRLTIPGAAALPDFHQDGTTVTPMSAEMRANAAIIVTVGRELGVSDRGIVIALAAAMQESSLRNIAYGDRDSLGLFQQRPSAGWGTTAQLLDAPHAARLFYGGPANPNRGITRGLLEIPGWQSMSLTQAAQAVQISAYPDAYAKWEKSAWSWLAQLS